MGCAAAMNGFRVANYFVRTHKGDYALMLCVEISSVHTNFDDRVNGTIIHSIFSDGCAACVLSGTLNSCTVNTCNAPFRTSALYSCLNKFLS